MSERVRELVAHVKSRLCDLYGERLRGVYLFGSYARGEADEESDVDILVVLDAVQRYSAEIELTSRLFSDASLQYGVSVSRVFVSESQWRLDQKLFFLNVREEAVSA